jgi:hypothetical protein
VLAPGALEFVAEYFRTHPTVDAIYSHRCIIDAGGKVVGHWLLPPHSNYVILRHDLIPQETCFWRRSLFERAGNVDPSFRFAMDYDLFARYMRAGKFVRVHRFLAAFRNHQDAKTSRFQHSIGAEEIRRVYEQHGIAWNAMSSALTRMLAGGLTNIRGNRFGRSGRLLPGIHAGLGYNYDRVWGGVLSEHRLPARAVTLVMSRAA